MILFKTDYLVIEFIEEFNYLAHHWSGFCTSDEFRNGISRMVDFTKEYSVEKILTNVRDQDLVRKEDTDWLTNVAIPKALSNGVRAQAFVLPTDIFTKISVRNFNNSLPNGNFTIKYFDDLEEASTWITQLCIEKMN